jgi:hypothetical protein
LVGGDRVQEKFLYAELLVARLSHDLASAIGATNNALELLVVEDNLQMATEILPIAAESSNRAAAFLNFFRFIYSANIAYDDHIPVAVVYKLFSDYFNCYKNIKANFEYHNEKKMQTQFAQLALNLAFITREFIPKGGGVFLNINKQITITIKSGSIKIKPDIMKILLDEEEINATSDNINVHFSKYLLVKLGVTLNAQVNDDKIEITIQQNE